MRKCIDRYATQMRQHCNRTVVSINEVASRRAADLREATGGGGTRTLLRHGKGEGGEREGGTPSGSRRGLEKSRWDSVLHCRT